MSYQLKIKEALKADVLADNAAVINVGYDIVEVDDEKKEDDETRVTILESRLESFPLESTSEDIVVALEKVLALYLSELDQKAVQAGVDAVNTQADETIDLLKDVTINPI